ncbi:hypothetical protein J2S43_002249 [Catenuloplanes nepalensis]|uniref:Uncharacterized protein n=1 Tax=Catenuloplanes nepalensis TaxID=587533 RepID=A0ABT9MQN6_9ACTN|nr:hypothetical protein [Catenuloplanes nepalensis]MDP9793737.1 hypothetical protein [Catenuloplanes nepalensis]
MVLHATIELPVLAGRCAAALGEELTAYLAGADTVAELDAWRSGAAAAPDPGRTVVRLAAGTELIRIFAAENLLSHLRHWLREMTDTEEGPLVPARAIRTAGTDIQPIKTVLQAAHFWVTERTLTRPIAA